MFIAKLDDSDMPMDESLRLAQELAESTIATYSALVQGAMDPHPLHTLSAADWEAQLRYHTLYLFQVLTLDRGTTHGLLAHSQNDVGTLASLPSAIDRPLLASWLRRLEDDPASSYKPQDKLVHAILQQLPNDTFADGFAAGFDAGAAHAAAEGI